MARRVWALDADLASAFDKIDHDHLLAVIGSFPARDMIAGWLKAGVFEAGNSAFCSRMAQFIVTLRASARGAFGYEGPRRVTSADRHGRGSGRPFFFGVAAVRVIPGRVGGLDACQLLGILRWMIGLLAIVLIGSQGEY